jgi:hypothetical protein
MQKEQSRPAAAFVQYQNTGEPASPGPWCCPRQGVGAATRSARSLGASNSYALSPYTVTVMSTTTSVCNATLTVLSPTTLIGPLGMRT